jgi:hypothetical protein
MAIDDALTLRNSSASAPCPRTKHTSGACHAGGRRLHADGAP